jgi:GT2 family glycosyltransferase
MALETISIVVLTYNRRLLLKDCLDSLLRQTSSGAEVEILVADDGSDDGTRELVSQYSAAHANIRWLYHEHQGIAATRNMGILAAQGKIIAIVADDYILDRNYIKIVLDFFRSCPKARIVRFKIVASRNDLGSRISHFYYDVSMRRRIYNRSFKRHQGWFETLGEAVRKMPLQTDKITVRHDLEASGGAAFHRDVFDQVGLFDENLTRAEDSDFTLRLRALGIDVYYYPDLHIKHQYERFMLDTLHKCFQSGRSRYHYSRKHSITPRAPDGRSESLLMLRFRTLLNALCNVETPGQFVVYAPCMVVFEVVNKLGYLSAWVFSRLRIREFKGRRTL